MTRALLLVGLVVGLLAALLGGSGTSSAIPSTASGQLQVGSLSSVQILNLSTTPVTVIAAVGPGTMILVDSAAFELVAGASAYTGSGELETQYAGAGAAEDVCGAGIFVSASNVVCFASAEPIPIPLAASVFVNKSVQLTASSALSAGNGTISYWIQYRILTGLL